MASEETKKLRKQENNNNYDDDTEEFKTEIMETFLCPHLHVLFKILAPCNN